MGKLKLVIFLGSVRDGRMGDRVLKFVEKEIDATKYDLEIIDPAQLDLPLLKRAMHFYRDPTQIPEVLLNLNAKVESADAFLIISPEYNRCVPPALVNTLDHVPPSSYKCKPSGMVMYSMGPHGGAIAGTSMRPFLSELGALPVSHFVTIGTVHKEMTEDGITENPRIKSSFSKLMAQVEWYGNALKNHRLANGTF